MSRPVTIAAIVTTFNEERNIARCLASLRWCDSILVVDSFSTDATPEIVRATPGVTLVQRPYLGAAAQKNWAMDQVEADWILHFDADEECTPALQAEIEALLAAGPGHNAYTIRRRVLFMGREIRFSGWQRDRVVRLVRKGWARYANLRVHERMRTVGPAPVLRNPMLHHMIDTFDEYVKRVAGYGYLGAAQAWRDGRRSGCLQVFFRPTWRFFRMFFLQLGFLDGMHGLVFCMVQSYATYVKWATLWAWRVNAARGRQPQLPPFDDDPATWEFNPPTT
ncbi:MAG: glycosyltransferase family 2 protein [Acidobacteriota bacterium]|jgi:glycosyltransferase involved in cell wall biosynthesis